MQGSIVRAAKWLGGSLVLASVILVVGFRSAPSSVVTSPAVAPATRVVETSAARVEEVVAMHDQAKALLTETENLRIIGDEWERFWFSDQPSDMTPYRTHGNLGP